MANLFFLRLKDFSDLLPRIFSGIFLVAVILGALFSGKIAWVAMMVVVACILGFEAFRMIAADRHKIEQNSVFILNIICYIGAYYFLASYGKWLLLLFSLLFFCTSYFFFKLSKKATLWLVVLLNYIGIACAFAIQIYDYQSGYIGMLMLFCLVWSSDTGAYIFGRIFGGPLLWPVISPKKTWSGFIGAFVFVIGLNISIYYLFPIALPLSHNLFLSISVFTLLCLVSQIGDFIQSWMKRVWQVKDMGNILPGHGGLFDRFDSLLFCLFCLQIYDYLTGDVQFLLQNVVI